MFHWLPGLPWSVRTETSDNTNRKVFSIKLGDPNLQRKPPGSKWAVEIHDGDRSWYVAYRGCTGYDSKSINGWCGKVQISHRDDGSTRSNHHAMLSNAGESATFGTGGFAMVTTPSAVPLVLPAGDDGYIEVLVVVDRRV